MMDWTDRHCRYFLRGFSPRVMLYTEMITAAAIVRGRRERLLKFDPEEQPLALQIGGSEASQVARAARIGEDSGYVEINLNCGCPSDRVHAGEFGACLMLQPQVVAEAVAAMRCAVSVPVTVKMRIGVVTGEGARAQLARYDDDDYQRLRDFTRQVAAAGCRRFIVHARKAVLGGFSPHDNRTIPPLRYDVVRELRHVFPGLPIILNGGLRTTAAVLEALECCDGVMLGREAYHRPKLLSELERALHPAEAPELEHAVVLERMAAYAERELARGERLPTITRHMLGLCCGEPGAREYRRRLSEGSREPGAGASLLRSAATILQSNSAREPMTLL